MLLDSITIITYIICTVNVDNGILFIYNINAHVDFYLYASIFSLVESKYGHRTPKRFFRSLRGKTLRNK